MNEHYYSENPSSKLKTRQISVIIRNQHVALTLVSGTFSAKKVDKGSLVLADYMKVNENDTVLDLGCGIGVIGLVASKLTKNSVILTDINTRAVEMAEKNTQGISNISILQGNLYEPVKDRKFDVILINVPQNAGRDICSSMIVQAKGHLNKNGSLQIVERHNRGGKFFEDLMQETFGNLEILAKKAGYWVCYSKLI